MDALGTIILIILVLLLLIGALALADVPGNVEEQSPSDEIRAIGEAAGREMERISDEYREQVRRYLDDQQGNMGADQDKGS